MYPRQRLGNREDLGLGTVLPARPSSTTLQVMESRTPTLGERFELRTRLGSGAAGEVFLAFDRKLERDVAVKLLSGEGPLADSRRFLAEARALAALRHPNILTVFDYGVADGAAYLVLELVDGGSLADRAPHQGLDPDTTRRIAGGILEALDTAHRAGILHRDVKPENVLLTRSGEPRLSDFGLVKDLHSKVQARTALGTMLGTPAFMAPELFRGKAASAASDVYSWGCLLYWLVNGRVPHDGTLEEIVLARSRPGYPRGQERGRLALLLDRALEHDPLQRAGTGELLEFLGSPEESANLPTRLVSSRELAGRGSGPERGRTGRGGEGRSGFRGARAAFPLVMLLAGAWFLRPTPAPVPDPGSEAVPAPADPTSGERSSWEERLGRIEAEPWLAARYAELLAGLDRNYHGVLHGWRQKGPPAEVKIRLETLAASLPEVTAFGRDRERMTGWLTDPEIPIRERMSLLAALQRVEPFDAFFRAAGLPAPYQADRMIEALLPRKGSHLDHAREPTEAIPEDRDPGPGEHLLFRWTHPVDEAYPCLTPYYGTPTGIEQAVWGLPILQSGGHWDPVVHSEIQARVFLDPTPAGTRRIGRLRFEVGNLLQPSRLRIEWNDDPISYWSDPGWMVHRTWSTDKLRVHRVTMDLPSELLLPGRNRVRITVEPLPGFPRLHGTDLDCLVLVLDPVE